jgi:glycosyltransferase involved in cell wall biosynthesis
LPPSENVFRKEWGLADKFVVGYSGNMGRGHDFQTIVSAAAALKEQKEIAFVFIGAGHQLSSIEEQAKTLSLHNIVVQPYQPPFRLSESLSVPDVHLVSLMPALENFMVPSKFYGVAAAGRPTIYIGDATGEIPTILKDADCGDTVAVGDVDSLVECILRLQQSPEQAKRWARNAREALLNRFDRHHAIDLWCIVLDRVVDLPVTPYPQLVKAGE